MTNSNEKNICGSTETESGDPCRRPAGWGTSHVGEGRCDDHPGRGAPEGNQNAVGNSGGGPPEGNQNAMKTGVSSDPVDLFGYLKEDDPEAAVWILAKLRDYARDVPFEVFVIDVTDIDDDEFDALEARMTARGDDLLQTCVRDYARWRAAKRQIEEGVISKQEKVTEYGKVMVEDSNPVNLDLDRLDRTVTRMKEKDGLLDSPDQQTANALESGLELRLSDGDKDALEAAFDTES